MSLEKTAAIKSEFLKINKSKASINMIEILKKESDIWDLFTRKEEYYAQILDDYARFPFYLSNNRNIFEPKASKLLMDNDWKIEYPENRKFAVCLTHDIDKVQLSHIDTVIGIAGSLYYFKTREALKKTFHKINKKWNPLSNFRAIIDLEEKYGAKSSFYFMGLRKGDLDFNYNVEDLSNEMGYITDLGWEVGLHGGHEAFHNLEALVKEKTRLEKALGKRIIGFRNHFLRFEVPDTWELLKKAGLKYDATLCYADCIGFRNGMCHPFKPFNLNTNAEIDILEIPLAIMDFTLYDTYMRLDSRAAWTFIKQLIDTTEMYNGVLTILWHNTHMTDDKLKLYKKILSYCQDRNSWMTSGEEICKFWSEYY